MSVRALRAALERIAALLVACVARHTALLTVEQGIRGALRRACVTAFPCKGMPLPALPPKKPDSPLASGKIRSRVSLLGMTYPELRLAVKAGFA